MMESEENNNADSHNQMDSSPLRSKHEEDSISSSDDSPPAIAKSPPSKAIISVDRFPHGFSALRSPRQDPKPVTPPPPDVSQVNLPVKPPSPVIVLNRSMREELSVVSKVEPGPGVESFAGRGVEDGGDRRSRAVSSILRRSKRDAMVKRAALVFRVFEVMFCLVSFSVMAADKTQGWAGDSFDRYKEYRYCISVNVIAFVYSGFQAYDLAYHLVTGKHILTYLLISASSSAATRVDEWQTNWGKDEFTIMASASIAMSFLAFAAFAFSSLISGYNLCTRN
ncbi:hypothetical protein HHK36_015594 [Tetracentron sinense]|uniref:CASP-like protein n=1 Tax=Tetracentron sinense TaxID=13715 RepID=A0A835DCZ1_TETSI|nr:hypothetical protein HHK36_015594 [Tetracentron sinense]